MCGQQCLWSHNQPRRHRSVAPSPPMNVIIHVSTNRDRLLGGTASFTAFAQGTRRSPTVGGATTAHNRWHR